MRSASFFYSLQNPRGKIRKWKKNPQYFATCAAKVVFWTAIKRCYVLLIRTDFKLTIVFIRAILNKATTATTIQGHICIIFQQIEKQQFIFFNLSLFIIYFCPFLSKRLFDISIAKSLLFSQQICNTFL